MNIKPELIFSEVRRSRELKNETLLLISENMTQCIGTWFYNCLFKSTFRIQSSYGNVIFLMKSLRHLYLTLARVLMNYTEAKIYAR